MSTPETDVRELLAALARAEQAAAEWKTRCSEAQSLLSSLFDQAPDGIFVADLDARFTDANEAACRMLGYSREEIVGKTIFDLIPPEDAPRLWQTRARHLEGGVHVSEWKLRRKDGTWLPVEISGQILPSGQWQGFARDITARKLDETALRRSEAKASGILAISADAIVSVDEQHRIIEWNKGAESMFGYSRAEAIGASLEMLIPERYRAEHHRHVHRFAEEPEAAQSRKHDLAAGLRKDGQEFPISATISKLSIEGVRMMTAAIRDITEQKRTENEQRLLAELGAAAASPEYEDALKRAAQAAVAALADYSSLFVVEDEAGRAVRRITAVARDPALAWCADRMMALPGSPRPAHPIWNVLKSQEPVIQPLLPEEYASIAVNPEQLRAFRTMQPKSALGVPLLAGDRCVGVLFLVSCSRAFDQRDLRVAQEVGRRCALFIENGRLHLAEQRAIRARDEVLRVVAHDLRNPLNSIVVQTAILRHHASLSGQSVRPAEIIERAAQRMNRIIGDLLDVTRSEAGHLAVERCRVSPRKLVADVAATQQEQIVSRTLELRLDLEEEDLPEVWADEHRVQQVFENLVSNAMKFTKRGSIRVGAGRRGDDVLFWVADTGAGIAERDLPFLFDRFWQACKTSRQGAGLGLAIAKELIEVQGGRIWAESRLGQGSTFFFTLPVAASH